MRAAVRRVERALGPSYQVRNVRSVGAGRWTLVDGFERDGTRYVVARSVLRVTDLDALTKAERKVTDHAARGLRTKEVAYALGISDVTVRVLLMRAARKCGVASRAKLIELWLGHGATCS